MMDEICWCGEPLDEYGRCTWDEALWELIKPQLAKAIADKIDPTVFEGNA